MRLPHRYWEPSSHQVRMWTLRQRWEAGHWLQYIFHYVFMNSGGWPDYLRWRVFSAHRWARPSLLTPGRGVRGRDSVLKPQTRRSVHRLVILAGKSDHVSKSLDDWPSFVHYVAIVMTSLKWILLGRCLSLWHAMLHSISSRPNSINAHEWRSDLIALDALLLRKMRLKREINQSLQSGAL